MPFRKVAIRIKANSGFVLLTMCVVQKDHAVGVDEVEHTFHDRDPVARIYENQRKKMVTAHFT